MSERECSSIFLINELPQTLMHSTKQYCTQEQMAKSHLEKVIQDAALFFLEPVNRQSRDI